MSACSSTDDCRSSSWSRGPWSTVWWKRGETIRTFELALNVLGLVFECLLQLRGNTHFGLTSFRRSWALNPVPGFRAVPTGMTRLALVAMSGAGCGHAGKDTSSCSRRPAQKRRTAPQWLHQVSGETGRAAELVPWRPGTNTWPHAETGPTELYRHCPPTVSRLSLACGSRRGRIARLQACGINWQVFGDTTSGINEISFPMTTKAC